MTEPQIFGDPETMRALAQEIAARADLLNTIPAGFAAALDGATFEGGAAVRLRGTASDARSRVAGLSAELRDIATALYADARSVETQNDEARTEAADEQATEDRIEQS
jgi:uncharacterized protein YukE